MNPGPSRFTVGLVGKAVGQFERLTEWAEQLDLPEVLAAAFRQIFEELETRPREWGDPSHNYRALDATGYQRAVLPAGLWVEYAVHNSDPLVWVSKVVVLEDSPFAGG